MTNAATLKSIWTKCEKSLKVSLWNKDQRHWPNCFQNLTAADATKCVYMWERVEVAVVCRIISLDILSLPIIA